MGVRPLFAVAALAAACASAQRPPSSSSPRRFVLVDAPSSLRTRADAAAPAVALPAGVPLAFRRVRARGDWVELETVDAPDRQCAAAVVPPRGLRLRFFAPSSSLLAVVARPLHVAGPEGSLTVAPGAAVREAPETGALEVVHAGLRVALATMPATARVFAEPHAEQAPDRAERLAPGTRAPLPARASALVGDGDPVYVLLRSAAAGGSRVVVATPCVRFESTVAPQRVLPVLEMELPSREPLRLPRWTLRAGARLRWPDGSPAGRAAAAVDVADEGRAAGALRCFRVPLRVTRTGADAAAAELEVCADPRDLAAT